MIAGEERVGVERILQIVAEVIDQRVIDRGIHAHLQLEPLIPVLRIVGPDERARLLEKTTISSLSIGPNRRRRATKIFPTKFPHKPLKRLVSRERIQGNPSFSNPS
jgi:hypothetical protein